RRLASAEIHPARGKHAQRRRWVRILVVERSRGRTAIVERNRVRIALFQAVNEGSTTDAVIEQAHAAADYQLAFFSGLPGKSKAGSKVIQRRPTLDGEIAVGLEH